MDSRNGYYNQWPSGQPPNRRFVPQRGTFSVAPQDALRAEQPNHAQQQYPSQFPHPPPYVPQQQTYQQPQAHFTPLIPLSAVEDLQLPQVPFTSNALPDTLSRVPFNSSGPVVHEGYIPAPGGNDEDDYPALPSNAFFRNRDMESSDDSSFGEELTFEEQMRELEYADNSEVDADYSEEDAQHDEGDPEEMELQVTFEDEEERSKRKKVKPGPTTDKPSRGGRRGQSSTRGRGGHSGSASTRKRASKKPGRPKGRRGPRPVADPGQEFRDLQREANTKFTAGEYQVALEYAQRAIQLNPEIFDAHNIASEIYAAMGDERNSVESLMIGAPTKRDPGLWHVIIERVNKLDPAVYAEYTEDAKMAITLGCLKQIVALDHENYEARSNILEIEASLGHVSKCVKMGRKMLKLRREKKKAPDMEVLKIMAMMGTSSKKQTKVHLEKLLASFDEAIETLTRKKAEDNDLDWEMINIYLDLLDRSQQYDYALRRLKSLARWKQGRSKEKFWDEQEDDREFDIADAPRRIAVPEFKGKKSRDAKHGQMLPLEIRVKLGIFRLRRSPDDFEEALHHLEMLEPDDCTPTALVWDYEDLFRVIADALHATGHDKDALRFYEPLYHKPSQELTLMSYIGIHTCYTNLGQKEKADPIIPILKEWNVETVDDLVVTAVFFEKQGMLAEAIQRAQILYRNKYAHRLRNLGFKAYDELREVYDQERKKARGKHGVRKSTVKKHRKLTSKAAGRGDVDDEDGTQDGGDRGLPSLGPLSERPEQGLFRTKKSKKPPKGQTFLPLQVDTEPEEPVTLRPTTLQGTGVPLHAIDHRFFRRKLEKLARDYSEELQAARAQHREITASFSRLDEISEAAERGNESAIHEVLSITRELIEEYSTFDVFYSDRKEDFTTYFRRTGNNEIWRESAIMVLAVVANQVEDGATDPELKERPDQVPQEFWGVHFDKWMEAFGRYAIILAREGDDERCYSTLDIAIQSNVVYRSKVYYQQLQLCRLVCALAIDDSYQASMAVRWLLKANPFATDLFRLYSCVNRLCSVPEGYSTGPSHKVLIRYIKTMDFALLTQEQRVWYNFRDRKDTTGGFQNSVNVEDVKFVKDHDPALFALYAHVLMCGGSYIAALNYYFRAFAMTPDDPMLNLSIGVAYIQHAMKRLSENRQFQIQQGLAFVNRYYELRVQENSAIHLQEAEFNRARIWHGLGLVSHAIPAYERVIQMSEEVRREADDRCTDEAGGYEDFKYEAAFAMQSIYAISGNHEGARKVTEEVLVLD